MTDGPLNIKPLGGGRYRVKWYFVVDKELFEREEEVYGAHKLSALLRDHCRRSDYQRIVTDVTRGARSSQQTFNERLRDPVSR